MVYASSATVSFFPYMFLLCLCFRVIDRPRRTRRVVRASSKISSEHSTASACFSNSYVLSSGRKFNSHRSPAAADAVQVRSHAGCGRSLCITEALSVDSEIQGISSSPHLAVHLSFNLLYSAAELLQVPSSKTKLKGSSGELCIAEVKSLPCIKILKVDVMYQSHTRTHSTN